MTTHSNSTECPFEYPPNSYSRLVHLDRTLPNVQKWALISNALAIADGEPYDPIKTYNLLEFVYTRYNMGQLYEVTQMIQLFYKPIPKNPEILSTFAGDTSKYMAELITEFCHEGYTYQYNDPKKPTCQCFTIEYLEDEFTDETPNVVSSRIPQFTYETPNIVSSRIPQFPPTCKECHGYEGPPKTDETTNEHFHLIPFPQRAHMVFPLFIWVLAFILEGYEYEFSEYKPDHVRRLSGDGLPSKDNVRTPERGVSETLATQSVGVAWHRECTHQYFKFYARYRRPSKKQLRDYQEYRNLCGEHFVEVPRRPKSITFDGKPSPVIPRTPTHMKRFPNFPKRDDHNDEPQWWDFPRTQVKLM